MRLSTGGRDEVPQTGPRIGIPPGQNRGIPQQDRGNTPPPRTRHAIDGIRRRRYTSCGDAGGLSCSIHVFIIVIFFENLVPKLISFFFLDSSSEEETNEDTDDDEEFSLESPNEREDNVLPAKDVKDWRNFGESNKTDKLSPLPNEAESADGCLDGAVVCNSIKNR